jgi:hypothetical protein
MVPCTVLNGDKFRELYNKAHKQRISYHATISRGQHPIHSTSHSLKAILHSLSNLTPFPSAKLYSPSSSTMLRLKTYGRKKVQIARIIVIGVKWR